MVDDAHAAVIAVHVRTMSVDVVECTVKANRRVSTATHRDDRGVSLHYHKR